MERDRHLTAILWFLILTLPIHIAEEFWGGEGFISWNTRSAGGSFSAEKFWALLAVGFVLVLTGALLVQKFLRMRWIVSAMAAIYFINGLSHLVATISQHRYSPGLISGLIWIPCCFWILSHENKTTTRKTYLGGALAGAAIHAVITLISSGRI
jgi:hypothetical protein